jgi:ABC transporter ATM
LLALALILAAKGILVTVPYIFKLSIDALAIPNDLNLMNGAGTLLIGYGVARITSIIMQELRNSIFSSVAQSAIRRASRQTFAQLISLDSEFHVSRQTGGLVSAINRGLSNYHRLGTKGINQVLSSLVFHLFPTALEVSIGTLNFLI